MKSELMKFLSQFHSLTSEEMGIIADLLTVREFNKGTILVKEGQICNECYFVLKGCLRQYMIIDGIEKTTQFYTENQTAVFFTSQIGVTFLYQKIEGAWKIVYYHESALPPTLAE